MVFFEKEVVNLVANIFIVKGNFLIKTVIMPVKEHFWLYLLVFVVIMINDKVGV